MGWRGERNSPFETVAPGAHCAAALPRPIVGPPGVGRLRGVRSRSLVTAQRAGGLRVEALRRGESSLSLTFMSQELQSQTRHAPGNFIPCGLHGKGLARNSLPHYGARSVGKPTSLSRLRLDPTSAWFVVCQEREPSTRGDECDQGDALPIEHHKGGRRRRPK